jgi:hypothetical protein
MKAVPLVEYLRSPLRLTVAEFAADPMTHLEELSKRPLVLTDLNGGELLINLEKAFLLATGLLAVTLDAVADPAWDAGFAKELPKSRRSRKSPRAKE